MPLNLETQRDVLLAALRQCLEELRWLLEHGRGTRAIEAAVNAGHDALIKCGQVVHKRNGS